jgi:hypothetical protein
VHRLGACSQPCMFSSCLGELSALLHVVHRPGRSSCLDASGSVARRPGSTRTGRGHNGSAELPPGRAWGAGGTETREHTIDYR